MVAGAVLAALLVSACSGGDTDTPAATSTAVKTAEASSAGALTATAIEVTEPTPAGGPTPAGTPSPGAPTATAPPETNPTTDAATRAPLPDGPIVAVGGVPFVTEVARTSSEQSRGLSGRAELAPQSGMLFPMGRDVVAAFWMRGMLIPLDFVWFGSDCRVNDVTENVPPPDDPTRNSGLPIYSPSEPIRYVFEINAGEIDALGIEVGQEIRFASLDLGNECG